MQEAVLLICMKPIIIHEREANKLINTQVAKLLQATSFPGGRISGEALLEFAPHKQISKFILFQIYQDWNAHSAKMRHPYFDYENPEAQEALRRYRNALSRHISVPREQFQSMLEKAIYNTLRLITDPLDLLNKFFFMNGDRISIELFKRHAHYFSDFDFVLQSINRYFEKNQIRYVEKDIFFQLFHKVVNIFESREGKNIQNYQEYLLDKAFGVKLNDILTGDKEAPKPVSPPIHREAPVKKAPEVVTPPPVVQPKEEEKPTPPPVEEIIEPAPFKIESPPTSPPVVEPKTPEVVVSPPKVEPQPEIIPPSIELEDPEPTVVEKTPVREEPKTVPPPVEEKPVVLENRPKPYVLEAQEDPEPDVKEEVTPPVYAPIDLFSKTKEEPKKEAPVPPPTPKQAPSPAKEPQTVMERFSNAGEDEPQSVMDSLTSSKNKTDLANIPVHKQFQFIQQLFGGSSVKYKVVVEKLQEAPNPDAAHDVLSKYVFNSPEVNPGTKIAKEFVGMVEGQY